MRKLIAFTQISADGCFADANGDMSWAHRSDPEFDAWVADNAGSGGTLVFGRVTYEMMAGYWPSPMARQSAPEVAAGMNSAEKIVFSRTLQDASWTNTKLVKGELVAEVRKLKAGPGSALVILGSGSVVAQLSGEGLVDEYQMVVNPLVLGNGRRLFEGVTRRVDLKLEKTRAFKNGSVLLCYQRVAAR